MDLVEEKLLYSNLILFSGILAKLLLAFACVPEAFIIVIDIHEYLVLEIDDLILIIAFLNFLHPFSLQFGPFVSLEVINRFGNALHSRRLTRTN